jgi:hypothetical protein
MDIQIAYKQKMAAQLHEWSAQLDLLEAKVENAGADVEIKRAKELNELRTKLKVASQKMTEFEKTSGDA